jgi:solute carrier family 36 (proton-coupled amino acid transporter)
MLHYQAIAKTRFRKLADIAVGVFGAVVMTYTTSLTIISWASGEQAPDVPRFCDRHNP